MKELIDFMNSYGFYVFGVFYLIVAILALVYFNRRFARIPRLYNDSKYDECINEIGGLPKMIFGYKKDWLNLYIGMSLIGKEKYSEAMQILVKIKHLKLQEAKSFWQCFAQLCLNRNEEAVTIFEKSNLIKDDLSYKILKILVYGEPKDSEVFAQVKNKVIIRYIETHFH